MNNKGFSDDELRKKHWQEYIERERKCREEAEASLKSDKGFLADVEAIYRVKCIELKRLQEKRSEYLRSDLFSEGLGDFAPYFRQRAFDEVLEGKRIPVLKIHVRNLSIAIKRAKGELKINEERQKKYENATKYVRIADVVRYFLNIRYSLRRPIKCCFHEDRTPSMMIYEKGNNFHCFGCGAHGSPIDFVMKIKNCSFKEAVEILSNF